MIRIIIMIVLLLTLPMIAYSQDPVPTPSKVGQPPQQQPNKIKTESPNGPRGTKDSPVFIETLERQVDRDDKVEERKYRENETSINKRLVFFTGLMLLVALGQAALFFYQLRLMRKTMIDTEKAASAAQKSAEVAEKTVEIMSDTAQRQLRAYIFVKTDDKSVVLDSDSVLTVTTIVKNFGQTPAHNIITSQHIGTYVLPISPDNPLDNLSFADNSSTSALAPGEVTYIRNNPQKLTARLIADIESGVVALFVLGEIKYYDSFGTPQSTKYRMFSTGEVFIRKGLTYYYDGNEAT
jgi:hypothetical protein